MVGITYRPSSDLETVQGTGEGTRVSRLNKLMPSPSVERFARSGREGEEGGET